MADDSTPTTTVRPSQGSDQTAFPKLSFGDMVKRGQALGYSKAGSEAIARNFMRESGGDPKSNTGDHGTSIGLANWHDGKDVHRKSDVEAYAKEQGKSVYDPDVQFKFFDKEMREKYPQLRAQLVGETDANRGEDAVKRIYERPASVLWGNTPGQLANDKYHYSDYAMQEHEGRPNTRTVMMDPQEYLDLSPELEGKPFSSPSGKSLKKSVDSGDAIESIPTMDVRMHGPTGVVTDQDGRHRALLAQQSFLEAIPVAMRQTGEGQPTELQGMSGNIVPADHPPVSQAQPGMWSKLANAIVPSAAAAEPEIPDWARPQAPAQQAQPPANDQANVPDWARPPPQQAEPDGMLMSAVKGAAAGLGKTVLGGQEFVGKGLEAVGATDTGKWLVDDARKGVENLNKETAADEKANPWSTGIGNFVGGSALPVGAAGLAAKAGLGALGGTLLGAGVGAATNPEGTDDHYWRSKLNETALGAGVGAAGNALVRGIANRVAAPALRATADLLAREGVVLTPGQISGGSAARIEEVLSNIPILGSAVRAAQRRSIETFNRAAMNRALEDIQTSLPPGITSGREALNETERLLQESYNQIIPNMRGIRDPVFMGDLGRVLASPEAQSLPQQYQDQLRHILQTEIVDRFEPSGHMAGDVAQDVGTRMDELINPLRRGNVYEQQLARLVRQADRHFDAMMDAHNGAFATAKANTDAGWAKFKTLQRASTYADRLPESPDGTFTPRQLLDAIKARDKSKDKANFARGFALMQDLGAAAHDVLPRIVPSDARDTRNLMMAGLTLGAGYEPHLAAIGAAAALPYLAPVRNLSNRILQRALNNPNPSRNALANRIRAAGPGVGTTLGGIPTMVIHPRGDNANQQ